MAALMAALMAAHLAAHWRRRLWRRIRRRRAASAPMYACCVRPCGRREQKGSALLSYVDPRDPHATPT
eukprot:7175514-Prymnesium_polylepis.1